MILWLGALIAIALTGCVAGSGSPQATASASATPPASASPTASAAPTASASPTASARASLQPASVQPTRIAGGGGADEITGVLGADSVEGGCAYLQAEDRTRYEVIYPDGWKIQATPLQLTNPEGEVVATGGETITVRGSEAGDMASICQIGPIFRAGEVVSIED